MGANLKKRHFDRIEFPLDVTVKIVSARETPKGASLLNMTTRNISQEGVCLETNVIEVDGTHLLSGSPFARENRLEMTIALNPDEPPFQATGEVRWYDIARDIPGCLYRVGVVFVDIAGNGKSQLARFLNTRKIKKGFFDKWLGKPSST